MRHFIERIKNYKEFMVGIVSFLVFLGMMTIFVLLFLDESTEVPDEEKIKATPTVMATPTPSPSDTPTPTPTSASTPTPTPTPSDTPTPTPTPTPLTAEQQRLMDQYNSFRSVEYEAMRAGAEKNFTLPVINITTLDGEEFKKKETVTVNGKQKYADRWITSFVEVFNCDEKYCLEERAEVKVRGNASAKEAPFPLRIKFENKQGMLGLNKGNDFKNWVLLRPWSRVVTDYMAFKMGQTIYDGDYYISDCTPVNVYVNGEYYGLYMLAEQNQVKKKRINVNEPEDGYSGVDVGYLVEIDNYAGLDVDSDPYFLVPYRVKGKDVTVKDFLGKEGTFVNYTHYTIHSDVYSEEQKDFISKYVNGVFEIIYHATEEDKFYTFDKNLNLVKADDRFKNAEETIEAVLDVQSAVDTYLIEEIMGNYDRGNGSFYMCVDFSKKSKYQKLTFMAPWDFNWCVFGEDLIAGTFYGITDTGRYKECVHPWFILLMKEDWFRQKVAKRWDELYSVGLLNKVTESTRDMIKTAAKDFDYFGKHRTNRNERGVALTAVSGLESRMKWLNKVIMEWLSKD